MSQADEANPDANADHGPAAAAALNRPWNDPALYDQSHTHLSCIGGALTGIILAGTLYPACLFFIIGTFQIIPGTVSGVGDLIAGLIFTAIAGGMVGMMISIITGVFSIVLVYLINRSLGYPANEIEAAMSAGSMAGYMPTVFVVFSISRFGDPGDVALSGALGPLLSMTMGAIGATWSASKWGGFDLSKAPNRQHSLSVFHLMMVTMWIAVTFAIANSFGGPEFAIAVAGWFVIQGFIIAVFRRIRAK